MSVMSVYHLQYHGTATDKKADFTCNVISVHFGTFYTSLCEYYCNSNFITCMKNIGLGDNLETESSHYKSRTD